MLTNLPIPSIPDCHADCGCYRCRGRLSLRNVQCFSLLKAPNQACLRVHAFFARSFLSAKPVRGGIV